MKTYLKGKVNQDSTDIHINNTTLKLLILQP